MSAMTNVRIAILFNLYRSWREIRSNSSEEANGLVRVEKNAKVLLSAGCVTLETGKKGKVNGANLRYWTIKLTNSQKVAG
jgi:hypothetical protein